MYNEEFLKQWNTSDCPLTMVEMLKYINYDFRYNQRKILLIFKDLCLLSKRNLKDVVDSIDYIIQNIDTIDEIVFDIKQQTKLRPCDVHYIELTIGLVNEPVKSVYCIVESFPDIELYDICNVFRKHIKFDDY